MDSNICPCCGQEKVSARAISLGIVSPYAAELITMLDEAHIAFEKERIIDISIFEIHGSLIDPFQWEPPPVPKYTGRLPGRSGRRRAQNKRNWQR